MCACTAVWCAGSTDLAADASIATFIGRATTEASVVSTRNYAIDGYIFGGWGPALRRVMPDPTGSKLWYGINEGGAAIMQAGYHQITHDHLLVGRNSARDNGSVNSSVPVWKWELARTVRHTDGVQQPTAFVQDGSYVYTYGVNIKHGQHTRSNTSRRAPTR